MSIPFGPDDYISRRELSMTGGGASDSGAASGGGSGQGATVFEPPNQAIAAQSFGDIVGPLAGIAANAGAGTPGGINYPIAQQSVYGGLSSNPWANQAIWGSDQAAQNVFNTVAPQAFDSGVSLRNIGNIGLGAGNAPLQFGLDTRYSDAINNISDNPFYNTALAGASDAANMGRAGAGAIQGLGGQLGSSAGQLGAAVSPLLQAGSDPQSALFYRTQGQLMDQTNAANAMAGVSGTPYGASVNANALGNFDINWQNQQLARQAQAAGAAGNLVGAQGSAANTASGLYSAAPGLMANTAGLPSGVYSSQIGQELQALDARNKAALTGATTFGSLENTGINATNAANAMRLSGANAQNTFGAAPYNTSSTIAQNALSGLTGLTSLGNNQFALPETVLNNLAQYMQLGQNASGLSGQLGNLGFNQTAQGLGGALSAGTSLLGSSGPFSSGGALGGGLGSGLGGLGAATADFGGGGTGAFTTAAGADAIAGAAAPGAGILSALPFSA